MNNEQHTAEGGEVLNASACRHEVHFGTIRVITTYAHGGSVVHEFPKEYRPLSKKGLTFFAPPALIRNKGLKTLKSPTTKNKPIFRVWMDSVARQNRPLVFRVFNIQALFTCCENPLKRIKTK